MDLLRPVDIAVAAVFAVPVEAIAVEIEVGEHVLCIPGEAVEEGTLYIREEGGFVEVVPPIVEGEATSGNYLLRMPQDYPTPYAIYRQGSVQYV